MFNSIFLGLANKVNEFFFLLVSPSIDNTAPLFEL